MSVILNLFTRLTVFFILTVGCTKSYAQQLTTVTLDAKKWAAALSKNERNEAPEFRKLIDILFIQTYTKEDNLIATKFFERVWADGDTLDMYFKARYNCAKANFLYFLNRKNPYVPIKSAIKKLLDEAIDIAYKTEDDYFIAFVSEMYSSIIWHFNELGLTIMYAMNVVELNEKINYYIDAGFYEFLADRLYQIREYGDCIKYGNKAVALWGISNLDEDKRSFFLANTLNTVALGYHRLQQFDSALVFYSRAYKTAFERNDSLWMSIVSGNMAQIYYQQKRYDTAYKLFVHDFNTCKAKGFLDDAANSLQWAARTSLALGNTTQALAEIRDALSILKVVPNDNYLKNVYNTKTEIFKQLSVYDSAFYYNSLYTNLNDSLEKIINTSSTAISKARLNDKVSRYNIQTLSKVKRTEILTRNIIIVFIILISAFALLVINRRQLQTKMEMEKAEQNNKLMEQEIVAAKEQMRMFTENIVEKTALIEKLEYQKQDVKNSAEKQDLISELSKQTILTEDDWLNFKATFEKIYPGFFRKIKDKVAEITVAEQRMAALTKLDLTSKQIASMLGISVDSVHKTRQRLRQRIQTDSNMGVDNFLADF